MFGQICSSAFLFQIFIFITHSISFLFIDMSKLSISLKFNLDRICVPKDLSIPTK